ncbi:hypothetical protein BDK51DRAFT_46166 [Blyttiomyces helicus]|uniref:Uncharacterized protein n=1 Tax=Blyttiomyces helicus TaxID=388810 RepID=A0A4P9W9S1_9FUNG|nr:hypothetical protein BDK51DRAFT_46166 [Blyttiomyces helicus]|eukprot:RKO89311.1 hypothetical protein BDK51DRAFT_46166 [Blyttiomyces helicus]
MSKCSSQTQTTKAVICCDGAGLRQRRKATPNVQNTSDQPSTPLPLLDLVWSPTPPATSLPPSKRHSRSRNLHPKVHHLSPLNGPAPVPAPQPAIPATPSAPSRGAPDGGLHRSSAPDASAVLSDRRQCVPALPLPLPPHAASAADLAEAATHGSTLPLPSSHLIPVPSYTNGLAIVPAPPPSPAGSLPPISREVSPLFRSKSVESIKLRGVGAVGLGLGIGVAGSDSSVSSVVFASAGGGWRTSSPHVRGESLDQSIWMGGGFITKASIGITCYLHSSSSLNAHTYVCWTNLRILDYYFAFSLDNEGPVTIEEEKRINELVEQWSGDRDPVREGSVNSVDPRDILPRPLPSPLIVDGRGSLTTRAQSRSPEESEAAIARRTLPPAETPDTIGRRKRGGWWDGTEDKEQEKERIKDLVRKTSQSFEPASPTAGDSAPPHEPPLRRPRSRADVVPSASRTVTPEPASLTSSLRHRRRNSSNAVRAALTDPGYVEEMAELERAAASAQNSPTRSEPPDEPLRIETLSRPGSSLSRSRPVDRSPHMQVSSASTAAQRELAQYTLDTPRSSRTRTLRHASSSPSLRRPLPMPDSVASDPSRPSPLASDLDRAPSPVSGAAESSRAAGTGGLDAAVLKEAAQLKARINQLQGKMQQSEHMALKYQKMVKTIVDMEVRNGFERGGTAGLYFVGGFSNGNRVPPSSSNMKPIIFSIPLEPFQRKPGPDISESQAALIMMRFCEERGLAQTAEAFAREARLPARHGNHARLRGYLRRKEFVQAVALVDKYLYIHLVQAGRIDVARQTLETVLLPHVKKEVARGGLRGEWFTTDFDMLQALLDPSVSPSSHNIYVHLDWTHETAQFWASARRAHRTPTSTPSTDPAASDPSRSHPPPPLYAHAVAECFSVPVDSDDDPAEAASLAELASGWGFRRNVRNVLAEVGEGASQYTTPDPAARAREPHKLRLVEKDGDKERDVRASAPSVVSVPERARKPPRSVVSSASSVRGADHEVASGGGGDRVRRRSSVPGTGRGERV